MTFPVARLVETPLPERGTASGSRDFVDSDATTEVRAEVKASGAGVRIVRCHLPTKSPWLNPIEPKWAHGQRKVVEPARLLPTTELPIRSSGSVRS
jgi:hypothetical protein